MKVVIGINKNGEAIYVNSETGVIFVSEVQGDFAIDGLYVDKFFDKLELADLAKTLDEKFTDADAFILTKNGYTYWRDEVATRTDFTGKVIEENIPIRIDCEIEDDEDDDEDEDI